MGSVIKKKVSQYRKNRKIIETRARTSRISSFRLGGENAGARKILQPSAETTDLTRRGNSNVLAPVSIISVFAVVEDSIGDKD